MGCGFVCTSTPPNNNFNDFLEIGVATLGNHILAFYSNFDRKEM